jgi:large subunit ribosomal protein L29
MKQSEITKLSKEDLQDKLVEYQKQLKDLKMTHAISPLENPLQIKTTRRVVARLQTALSNQEHKTWKLEI